MAKAGVAARASALFLLGQVTGEGRLLSELLPGALERLPVEDRARAQRLALTTLRWMDRADRMLGPYLKRRPGEEVHNILRLGVVEMAVDGSAPHGTVDVLVSLARKSPRGQAMAGLVNAVLRRVAVDLERWQKLPVPRLPKWLRGPLIAGYGKPTVAAMEAVHCQRPPLDVTVRDAEAVQRIAERLGGSVLHGGTVRVAGAGQVSALPGDDAGGWWVQDVAAAMPARVLAPARGERVLDMCAAPGGKTMQIAAAGAVVTALDVSGARLGIVAENLKRTGLSADLIKADALEWPAGAPFDAILLDAPCSATGTIRRHPDLPYAKDGTGWNALFGLQAAMIDRAVAHLRPGGRLVYCTCSLLPDEGEVQIEAALVRHRDLVLDKAAIERVGLPKGWSGQEGLRLRPDYWAEQGGMDGFFVAALRKAA